MGKFVWCSGSGKTSVGINDVHEMTSIKVYVDTIYIADRTITKTEETM